MSTYLFSHLGSERAQPPQEVKRNAYRFTEVPHNPIDTPSPSTGPQEPSVESHPFAPFLHCSRCPRAGVTPVLLHAPSEQNFSTPHSGAGPPYCRLSYTHLFNYPDLWVKSNGMADSMHSHSLLTQNGQGGTRETVGVMTDCLTFSSFYAPPPSSPLHRKSNPN